MIEDYSNYLRGQVVKKVLSFDNDDERLPERVRKHFRDSSYCPYAIQIETDQKLLFIVGEHDDGPEIFQKVSKSIEFLSKNAWKILYCFSTRIDKDF